MCYALSNLFYNFFCFSYISLSLGEEPARVDYNFTAPQVQQTYTVFFVVPEAGDKCRVGMPGCKFLYTIQSWTNFSNSIAIKPESMYFSYIQTDKTAPKINSVEAEMCVGDDGK
jgi:hypothetical protein